MTGYALDNSWERARRRLTCLEAYLDPITKRRISALSLRSGFRCLEVGGGGGSIAAWLCEMVGPAGSVVATDINIQFLKDINHSNLEVKQHDVVAEALPGGDFDFVHTRWLLHHLQDPELVIVRMIDALRPGGWLLIEEVDFFPIHTSSSQTYIDFMVALTGNVVKASGRDCFWARALPGLIANMGLHRIEAEGDFPLFQGGSPTAEFFSLTAEQMRDQLLTSGLLTETGFNNALELLKSPAFWACGGGGIAVWGQRPE